MIILLLWTLLWSSVTGAFTSVGQQGAYHAFSPVNTAAGQLSMDATITVTPPQYWGTHSLVENLLRFYGLRNTNDIYPPFDANGLWIADRLEISFVSLTTEIPFISVSASKWAPFNQYPPFTWHRFDLLAAFLWRGLDTPSTPDTPRLRAEFANFPLVTSTPPCLFSASIAAGGEKLTLFLVMCAPSIFGLFPGVAMFDALAIHLPWPYLSTNPENPQVLVQTQATFYTLVGLSKTRWTFDNPPVATYNVTGPYMVNSKWMTTVPEVQLSTLQFYRFFPGAPSQGIKINTIAGTKLQAMTFDLQLGAQLQAGDTITLSVSTIPLFTLEVSRATLTQLGRPVNHNLGKLDSLKDKIWADIPTTLAAFAVGPACSRWPGSVNCCSQSVAQVLLPYPSALTYPSWWKSFVITLGPAGCVIPADKRFEAVIPEVYLGYNPEETDFVLNVNDQLFENGNGAKFAPAAVRDPTLGDLFHWPGFVHVDARVQTVAEPAWHILQRFSETAPLAWQGNWPAGYPEFYLDLLDQENLDPSLIPIPGYTLIPALGEPAGLPNPMLLADFALVGGPSPYVVGKTAITSLEVQIDTVVAGAQPKRLRIKLVLPNPLPVRPHPDTDTWYWILITANQGVFRSNMGSLDNRMTLEGITPPECAHVFSGLTTAYGTLMATFENQQNAACLAVLAADDKVPLVIEFAVPGAMLLQNPAGGSDVYFDARIVPPMETRVYGREVQDVPQEVLTNLPLLYGGSVVNIDAAAIMNVFAYTTIVECGTMPWMPSSVTDVASQGHASRCYLIWAITQISPVTNGFLQCNPGANVNNALNLVTFAKYGEGSWSSVIWPKTNAPAPSSAWPQNVGLPGTPPVFITNWGMLFSTPMFAVVVTYPPSRQALQGLGAIPSVPATWQVAFIVKIDRLTSACSVVNEENPWTFCVVTPHPVVSVLHFPSVPIWTWWAGAVGVTPNSAGVPVNTVTHSNWGAANFPLTETPYGHVSRGVCVTVISDGAVAGYYTTAASPVPDDESSPAWYAFFALFAIPLLLALCLLIWWLCRPRAVNCCPTCPMEPENPVNEVYWVNAPPMFMVEPIATAPRMVASPPASPMSMIPMSPRLVMQ